MVHSVDVLTERVEDLHQLRRFSPDLPLLHDFLTDGRLSAEDLQTVRGDDAERITEFEVSAAFVGDGPAEVGVLDSVKRWEGEPFGDAEEVGVDEGPDGVLPGEEGDVDWEVEGAGTDVVGDDFD